MKNLFKLCCAFLFVLVAGIGVVSCMTPEAKQAHDAVINKYQEINADGTVTQVEADEFKRLVEAYYAIAKEDLGTFDWETLAGTTISSVLLSIFGVNYMRNRSMPGTNRLE